MPSTWALPSRRANSALAMPSYPELVSRLEANIVTKRTCGNKERAVSPDPWQGADMSRMRTDAGKDLRDLYA